MDEEPNPEPNEEPESKTKSEEDDCSYDDKNPYGDDYKQNFNWNQHFSKILAELSIVQVLPPTAVLLDWVFLLAVKSSKMGCFCFWLVEDIEFVA